MERNNLLVSATKNSPIVLQIKKIKNSEKQILRGLDRISKILQVSLSSYQKINNETLEYCC